MHFLPLAKLPVLGRSHAFSGGEQNFKMKRARERERLLAICVQLSKGQPKMDRAKGTGHDVAIVVGSQSSQTGPPTGLDVSPITRNILLIFFFFEENKFKVAIRRQVRETPPLGSGYANEKCELQDRHDLLQWISESQLKRGIAQNFVTNFGKMKWEMTVKILSTSSYWPTMNDFPNEIQ